jgi:hypothetical protein
MSGANIYIPQGFTLREILKFVLSVLGLTWQNIRQKLVRAVGETAVRVLETGFDIVVTLVTQGPAAAWEKIQETLSNLREMVIEQIMTFVRDRVVTAAVTRLLSMLSPVGAFIQAIIAIYNTVMFFVERLRQIAQVAAAFIDSISAIASGVITAAANRVEQTMAGLLTLVISFLARIAGLGRVTDAVTSVIDRVRQPIDRALDRVVDWIVATARRIGRFIAQAGVPQDPNERLRLAGEAAVGAARRLSGRMSRALMTPVLAGIRTRYGLQSIEPYERGGTWWVRASINPASDTDTGVSSQAQAGAGGATDEVAAVRALIGTKIVTPVDGGPARLSLPGGRTEIVGYQIRLGSATEVASIRKVRRPEGSPALPDVHITNDGTLTEGQRPGQNRSDEATKLGMYRTLATELELGLGPILPEVTEANVTVTTNSRVRGALRDAILGRPEYQSLAGFNRLISSSRLTGPGMQGELFEAWVVRHFGTANDITDNKIKYKVDGETGIMDRFSGQNIVEIKSRRRPADVAAGVRDDDISDTKFTVDDQDRAQFPRYAKLVRGQGEVLTKSSGELRVPSVFTGANYYFNFLGAARLFGRTMPLDLKTKTTFFVGGRSVPI